MGRDDYRIVGLTRGQVDIGGDGMLFVSILDAQTLDLFVPSEAICLVVFRTGNKLRSVTDKVASPPSWPHFNLASTASR